MSLNKRWYYFIIWQRVFMYLASIKMLSPSSSYSFKLNGSPVELFFEPRTRSLNICKAFLISPHFRRSQNAQEAGFFLCLRFFLSILIFLFFTVCSFFCGWWLWRFIWVTWPCAIESWEISCDMNMAHTMGVCAPKATCNIRSYQPNTTQNQPKPPILPPSVWLVRLSLSVWLWVCVKYGCMWVCVWERRRWAGFLCPTVVLRPSARRCASLLSSLRLNNNNSNYILKELSVVRSVARALLVQRTLPKCDFNG